MSFIRAAKYKNSKLPNWSTTWPVLRFIRMWELKGPKGKNTKKQNNRRQASKWQLWTRIFYRCRRLMTSISLCKLLINQRKWIKQKRMTHLDVLYHFCVFWNKYPISEDMGRLISGQVSFWLWKTVLPRAAISSLHDEEIRTSNEPKEP